MFFMQTGTSWQRRSAGGVASTALSPLSGVVSLGAVGSGYNPGIYPWTASGGGCAREPSGVWAPYNGTIDTTDPGFGCNAAPTIAPASIPGVGAQQATGGAGSTTCVSNSPVAGEMTVTTTMCRSRMGSRPARPASRLPASRHPASTPAITPRSPARAGTTLVLETTTGGGTCPASTAVGRRHGARSGPGRRSRSRRSRHAPLTTNYGFGITAKSQRQVLRGHRRVWSGFGDAWRPVHAHGRPERQRLSPARRRSPPMPQPGRAQLHRLHHQRRARHHFHLHRARSEPGRLDDGDRPGTGRRLRSGRPSPGLRRAGNEHLFARHRLGRFAGRTYVDEQFLLSSQTNTAHTYAPALTVTAMASYSVSAASWASGTFGNGQVTLTTTAAHPFIPGSVLHVSGFTETERRSTA